MNWRSWIPPFARRFLRDRLYAARLRRDPFRIGLDAMAPHLPSAAVIVEAGAHAGGDTRALARRWPAGRVYALEPIPELYAALVESVADQSNVSCHQLALGPENAQLPMWVSSGASDGSSSLRAPKTHLTSHPDVTFDDVVTVESVTLDSFAAAQGIEPDLLWLDLQGGELDALRAGEHVLRSARLIHAEVSVLEEYEGCALYPEVRDWLATRGFEVLVEALPPDEPQGNVLFLRSAG